MINMTCSSSNNKKIYSIYIIHNLANGKKYIGATNNTSRRWKEHLKISRQKFIKYAIHFAIKKYGYEMFYFSILESNLTFSQAMKQEKKWIKYFKKLGHILYNETNGGEGRSGVTISKNMKNKLSKRMKGKNNYFYGKKLCGNLNGNYGRKMKPHVKSALLKCRSKLKKQQVIEIRSKYKYNNYSISKLSKEYKISQAQIHRIVNYKRWQNID